VFPGTLRLLEEAFNQRAVTRSEQVARTSLVEEPLENGSLRPNHKLALAIVDDRNVKAASSELVQKIRRRRSIPVRGIELHHEHP
jgi:hypothetical protein